KMSYIIICGLLWDDKRFQDALSISFNFIHQFHGDRVMGAFLLGNTYFRIGDFHKSLENGLQIIEMDNSHLEGRILVAISYHCLGDLKSADKQFKILESDPRTAKDIVELKNELDEICREARESRLLFL
ncbi:MAG: hypothetical protein AAGU32_12980, partial [Bacillota bacterium]